VRHLQRAGRAHYIEFSAPAQCVVNGAQRRTYPSRSRYPAVTTHRQPELVEEPAVRLQADMRKKRQGQGNAPTIPWLVMPAQRRDFFKRRQCHVGQLIDCRSSHLSRIRLRERFVNVRKLLMTAFDPLRKLRRRPLCAHCRR